MGSGARFDFQFIIMYWNSKTSLFKVGTLSPSIFQLYSGSVMGFWGFWLFLSFLSILIRYDW